MGKRSEVYLQGVIGLSIIGFFCSLVGLFMSYNAVSMVRDYYRAQQWIVIPAYIDEVVTGYEQAPQVHYRYHYLGEDYKGSRIGLTRITMTSGSHFSQNRTRFVMCYEDELPVDCYVNPAQPSDAMLFRDFRVKDFLFILLFAIPFGAAGLVCFYVAYRFAYPKNKPQKSKGSGKVRSAEVSSVIEDHHEAIRHQQFVVADTTSEIEYHFSKMRNLSDLGCLVFPLGFSSVAICFLSTIMSGAGFSFPALFLSLPLLVALAVFGFFSYIIMKILFYESRLECFGDYLLLRNGLFAMFKYTMKVDDINDVTIFNNHSSGMNKFYIVCLVTDKKEYVVARGVPEEAAQAIADELCEYILIRTVR